MKYLRFGVVLLLSMGILQISYGQKELNVIYGQSPWLKHSDARNALYRHFSSEAFAYLEKRKEAVAATQSVDEWKARQRRIRETLLDIVGPFPARAPLNPRITRTVAKDFYRIEHIVFESQPGMYVTSSLFIPNTIKRKDKAPAIIYCSGHADQGYRSNVYQKIIINLVKKGFVVFAFDPVGQGERLEYIDPSTGKQAVGGPTTQHSYPGTQLFISGGSQARYMIWDGIRAVDYLLTRKEVDPARIGITGRSGGGTQSAYIAAFDERIAAAAPECYITSFARLLESIGPQDAEQNFPGAIARGIDHADLLTVRAPKPTMIISTTRDFFSIQGARETATEVARAFKILGSPDNFSMVEDDAAHASTKKNRESMYAFFQKHLNNPGEFQDEELSPPTDEELKVTTTGQVLTSLRGETIFSLNKKEISRQESASTPEQLRAGLRRSGYREPSDFEMAVFNGRLQRDGYSIEKYFVKGEGDYVVPFLVAVPEKSAGTTILYLHPEGKNAAAAEGGDPERLVKEGYTVVMPDLPGLGELSDGELKGDAFIGGVSHNIWYSALLVGRSIVAVQAADLQRVLHAVGDLDKQNVYAIAHREVCSTLLHAAAFEPKIRKIALIEPLISFRSLVEEHHYHSPFITGAVPGMLRDYDLPDLAASLAPRQLLIVNPLNGAAKPAQLAETDRSISRIRKAYEEAGNSGAFSIVTDGGVNNVGRLWRDK